VKTIGALLTQGKMPGDFYGRPAAFVMSSTEEEWERDILPTLRLAGANTDLAIHVNLGKINERKIKALKDHILRFERETGIPVAFVIIDALKDHVKIRSPGDFWDDSVVRPFLTQIQAFARELDLGVIGVVHPNKSTGSTSGSGAWEEVPRTILRSSKLMIKVEQSNLGKSGKQTAISARSAIVGYDEQGKGIEAWITECRLWSAGRAHRASIGDRASIRTGSGGLPLAAAQ
jgi:hypothetical protein